jgi:hypothetical protein
MIESSYRRVELYDNVAEYADAVRSRHARLFWFMMAVLTLIAGILAVVVKFAPTALPYAPLLALGALVLIALPVVIWNNPRIGLYILVISACLFMQAPLNVDRDPFGRIPLFWNISTTVNFFTGSNALEFLHMNLGEVIMAMTALFWLLRQITLRELRWNSGAFFGWFALYLVWCGLGFIRGMQKGGDTTTALWELRAQAYFALAYLLAANLLTDRKHAMTVLWMIAIGIGFKSIVGTANYIKNPDVSADEGVLSHEDSLLCNILLFGALLFSIAKVEPKLKWAFLAFVPTALAANMANGRRAGIAAFIVAFPVVIAMCAVLLKERRKALTLFMIVFAFCAAIYLPLAWKAEGAWALPARAIRSRTAPDGRDAASDYYRLAENNNLKITRDTSPWLGYGYGRPYIVFFQQPGRFDPFMNVLPHNGILWIWMRLGNIGFTIWWMFVATVLVRGPMLLKTIRDPRLQVLGILAIAVFLMQIIYGEYDLCFANYRTMWLTGTLLGILAVLPRLVELKQEEREAQGKSFAGQGTEDDLDVREVDEEDAEEEAIGEVPPPWKRLPGAKGVPGWTRGADW